METPAAERPFRPTWEAALPLALLALRLTFATRQPFYLDWMVVFSVYWILYLFLRRTRAIPAVTAGAMVALLAIYLSRELWQVIDTLLLCR